MFCCISEDELPLYVKYPEKYEALSTAIQIKKLEQKIATISLKGLKNEYNEFQSIKSKRTLDILNLRKEMELKKLKYWLEKTGQIPEIVF